jgi:hypothetical protein
LIDVVCVRVLELVRYHIKEAKGRGNIMITMVGLYLWTFE